MHLRVLLRLSVALAAVATINCALRRDPRSQQRRKLEIQSDYALPPKTRVVTLREPPRNNDPAGTNGGVGKFQSQKCLLSFGLCTILSADRCRKRGGRDARNCEIKLLRKCMESFRRCRNIPSKGLGQQTTPSIPSSWKQPVGPTKPVQKPTSGLVSFCGTKSEVIQRPTKKVSAWTRTTGKIYSGWKPTKTPRHPKKPLSPRKSFENQRKKPRGNQRTQKFSEWKKTTGKSTSWWSPNTTRHPRKPWGKQRYLYNRTRHQMRGQRTRTFSAWEKTTGKSNSGWWSPNTTRHPRKPLGSRRSLYKPRKKTRGNQPTRKFSAWGKTTGKSNSGWRSVKPAGYPRKPWSTQRYLYNPRRKPMRNQSTRRFSAWGKTTGKSNSGWWSPNTDRHPRKPWSSYMYEHRRQQQYGSTKFGPSSDREPGRKGRTGKSHSRSCLLRVGICTIRSADQCKKSEWKDARNCEIKLLRKCMESFKSCRRSRFTRKNDKNFRQKPTPR